MKTVGIICEYNPFHRGHQKQIRMIKERFGQDCAVVCLMSGNFVQRGYPAIFDKSLRARAAVACGADLVLELPVNIALSSAEGFAAGGVRILFRVCDGISFGCEQGDRETLLQTASALLSSEFSHALHRRLDEGVSFPAARAAALRDIGVDPYLLESPNDLLGVEYCKAILCQNSSMKLFPVRRMGSYHAQVADAQDPSATAVRNMMCDNLNWRPYVPEEAADLFEGATVHTLTAGERAMLAHLRTMTDMEFEALPYGSEGLWRKFMHACRTQGTLETIITATKSKRYTRTRLDRMAMCAYLGITEEILEQEAPYTRVLAFNDLGREVLSKVKHTGYFRNAGEPTDDPYWLLEKRWGDLYGLFSVDGPEAPGVEENRRIFYQK